ncbi:GSCOCG00011244001-RA-CDS, partial [Cotesia congregata]
IEGLLVNASSSHSVTFAGKIEVDGTCKGTTYDDPYGSWNDVVVQGYVEILLQEYHTQVDVERNLVFLRSGIACPLAEGRCADIGAGHTFWSSLPTDCSRNRFEILYSGPATRLVDEGNNTTRYKEVVYTVVSKDVTFA